MMGTNYCLFQNMIQKLKFKYKCTHFNNTNDY